MKQITSSDLRIGNWLYRDNVTKEPMQIQCISKFGVHLDYDRYEGSMWFEGNDDICSIPITKKLVWHLANNIQDVVECGYGIEIGCASYIEVRMKYKDNELYLIPTTNCDEYDIGEPISYVHELQNIYHALTGKELEIRREWL